MRVLLIEDDPDILLICRLNLELSGHEVLEASNGEQGFELAISLEPRHHRARLDVAQTRRPVYPS